MARKNQGGKGVGGEALVQCMLSAARASNGTERYGAPVNSASHVRTKAQGKRSQKKPEGMTSRRASFLKKA